MKSRSKFNHNRQQAGFSLIEMLVVVAIMLVIVAAFAPAVVASIQSGNEQSTVNSIATFAKAETQYSQLYPALGYSAKAANLGGTAAQGCPASPDATGTGVFSCLIPNDNALAIDAGNQVAGYKYTFTGDGKTPSASWTLQAVPNSAMGGRKSYCTDASGQVRYALGMTAPTATNNVCSSGTIVGQ
jgi:type IV pilus assembly protein PilA